MKTVKCWAVVYGVVFLVVGILGYVPAAVSVDGHLFGIFAIDSMHNMVHIVTGIIALVVAMKVDYAKLYFKVFGVIYGIVAVLGFVGGGDMMVMHMNMADHILHLVVAVVALYVGFSNHVKVHHEGA